MTTTVIGWILWGVVAIFAVGCLFGRGTSPLDWLGSRVMGVIMAIGLAVIATLHLPKIHLLWLVYVAFLVDHLITRVELTNVVGTADPSVLPVLARQVKQRDAGCLVSGIVVFAIVAATLWISGK